MVDPAARARLEEAIGHRFIDEGLLVLALTHRSYTSEHEDEGSYERLEFLGDAVLQLAVTDYLYERYTDLEEGEMAKVRAAVVNERTLAHNARQWGVGDVVLLGRGEELTAGREKSSILSDVVESLLGAVYREAGYETVRNLVLRHWAGLIDERATDPGSRDYKTRLQEWLARDGLRPHYEIDDTGPEHAKQFTARVRVDDRILGEGTGTSKKRAEQAAARAAAIALGNNDA
jgi:ribonuclease-3